MWTSPTSPRCLPPAGTRIGQYRATYQKVQNICQIEESRLGHSLVQHIYRHYREDLSAAGVARAFGISVQQLNRTLLCQVELNLRISWP